MKLKECPVCGGPGEFMGVLFELVWARCRNCGMDYKAGTVKTLDEVVELQEEE